MQLVLTVRYWSSTQNFLQLNRDKTEIISSSGGPHCRALGVISNPTFSLDKSSLTEAEKHVKLDKLHQTMHLNYKHGGGGHSCLHRTSTTSSSPGLFKVSALWHLQKHLYPVYSSFKTQLRVGTKNPEHISLILASLYCDWLSRAWQHIDRWRLGNEIRLAFKDLTPSSISELLVLQYLKLLGLLDVEGFSWIIHSSIHWSLVAFSSDLACWNGYGNVAVLSFYI